jgi:hypothetical protein
LVIVAWSVVFAESCPGGPSRDVAYEDEPYEEEKEERDESDVPGKSLPPEYSAC